MELGQWLAVDTARLHNSTNLDDVLSSAVGLAREVLRSDVAAIGLVGEDGYLTFHSFQGLDPRVASGWRKHKNESLTGVVFRTGRPYSCTDVLADRRHTGKTFAEQGVRGLLLVPLKVGREIVGCLYVGHQAPHRFRPDEIRLARLFADQAARSVENAMLFDRERRQRTRSEVLVNVLSAASLGLSLKKVLIKLCQSVVDLSVADRCTIYLFEPDGRFTPIMSLGMEDPELWQKLREITSGPAPPEDQPYLDAIRRLRKPVVQEQVPGSGVLPEHMVETFGTKSIALYPLVARDETIGVMTVDSFRQFVRFPPDEVETFAAIARQAAVIIENARLFEQEQAQHRRTEALLEVVSTAGSTLSLKKALIKLCQSVVDLSVADRCSIFLFDEAGKAMPVMSLGIEDPELWERFQSSAGLEVPDVRGIGDALKIQEPVIEEHVPGSGILPDYWIDAFALKSLALYPLVHKEKTVGVMAVDSFRQFVHFPPDEVQTLNAIARQAAIVIENARLFEEEQRQRQRTEALLEVVSSAGSTLSLKEVLVRLCRSVVDLSVADRCSIFLFHEESRALEPFMSLGPEDPALWEKFRSSAGIQLSEIPREVVARILAGEAVVEERVPGSGTLPDYWAELSGAKSIAIYPLAAKERLAGIMAVDSFRDFVHFPPEEIETLAAIAKQAAIIIENARLHDRLREQAVTDAVTGLYNHRHLHERLDQELARAARSGAPLAILMIDLDNFKLFNDIHGHPMGDEALKFVGTTLRGALRKPDIIGRYGGDEFLAVLPETDRTGAERIAGRLMRAAEKPFQGPKKTGSIQLGLSVGIACYPADSSVKDELIALADGALYEAKRRGGARVVSAGAAAADEGFDQDPGFGLLQGLLSALGHKDPYTRAHCEDNLRYVAALGDRLDLSATERRVLRKAALLHDVGKIAIPDRTLTKPGPLNSDEWDIMKQHVLFGELIVRGISGVTDAIEPVASHHERYNGQGYPRGLRGEEIPLLGRILAVVDAYSAMTHDRPYRKALTRERAIAELRMAAGTQFDPQIVEAFLEVVKAEGQVRRRAA